MAMEFKTVEVKNELQQATIEFWTQFGWNLKSSQRIYNKSSHLEQRASSTYSVTETVDFTRLVFERDKNGPNYSQIARLENEWLSLSAKLPASRPAVGTLSASIDGWAKETKPDVRSKMDKFLSTIAVCGGIVLWFVAAIWDEPLTTVMQVVGLVAIVAGLILKFVMKKSKLTAAINHTDSEAEATLEILYADAQKKHSKELEAANQYDMQAKKMKEIMIELESLI